MKYFDKDFTNFFKELEKNNSKEWFDKNRKRYEKSVKEPFKKFVLDLIEALQKVYPNVDLSNEYSIMRINRDIRFSADKTPYKIHMGSMIMPNGKKDKTKPGFYIQANHKDVRVYSGAHMLEKEQLQAARTHIRKNLKEFDILINDKDFVQAFGEILGEKNKRLPKEFKEVEDKQPLIANKSFYWYFKLKPETLTRDGLIDALVSRHKNALPLNRFFEKALDLPIK